MPVCSVQQQCFIRHYSITTIVGTLSAVSAVAVVQQGVVSRTTATGVQWRRHQRGPRVREAEVAASYAQRGWGLKGGSLYPTLTV
jgi:hypothetical protein